jgi:hypothetical protein
LVNEFCAKYLCQLVDAYLRSERATTPTGAAHDLQQNPWLRFICRLPDSRYWGKYLYSHRPIAASGKRLGLVLAQQLYLAAPVLDRRMKAHTPNQDSRLAWIVACRSMEILRNSLPRMKPSVDPSFNDSIDVTETLRENLLKYIRPWCEGLARLDEQGSIEAQWTIMVLENSASDYELRSFRQDSRGWLACGLPGCRAGADLKVCARYALHFVFGDRDLIDAFLAVRPPDMYVHNHLKFLSLRLSSVRLNTRRHIGSRLETTLENLLTGFHASKRLTEVPIKPNS